ncbi:perlwapin-like [Gigantopelta aegis]|uniref:perlwapin-like n=1 Tax=Gigantopelta aegis TaxID=1735272 RepID=UPI001B88DE60|nr:perlwapin-like [Gigantopelta aegis]
MLFQLYCHPDEVCRIYPQWCKKPPCPRKPTCIYPRSKPGYCPMTIIPFPGMFGPKCDFDYDCPGRMVCCGHPESRCIIPYKSSGQCPRSEPTTKCGPRCTDDFDCGRGLICCNFKQCVGKVCSWPRVLDRKEMADFI